MRISRLFLGLALLAGPVLALGETAYVTDQVTVELRADVTPDAPVVTTVSTGAALEVLERVGSFARVRTNDGMEGWIEDTALMRQPPAAAQLRSLRTELERTRAQLVNAQAQLDQAAGAASRTQEAEVAKLRNELAAARQQLADAQAALKKKDEELVQLAAAAQRQPPPIESLPQPLPPQPAPSRFSFLWLGISFAMLVIGFIGGIVWVRESIRRRMGGMYLRI